MRWTKKRTENNRRTFLLLVNSTGEPSVFRRNGRTHGACKCFVLLLFHFRFFLACFVMGFVSSTSSRRPYGFSQTRTSWTKHEKSRSRTLICLLFGARFRPSIVALKAIHFHKRIKFLAPTPFNATNRRIYPTLISWCWELTVCLYDGNNNSRYSRSQWLLVSWWCSCVCATARPLWHFQYEHFKIVYNVVREWVCWMRCASETIKMPTSIIFL